MKRLTLSFFALAGLLFSACNSTAPEEAIETREAEEVAAPAEEESAATYTVSLDGDEINWEGYETFSGDNHYGTIQVSEGKFMTENGQLVGGSFVIDMGSIHSQDLAEDPGSYKKLVGHLKSPDFFAVDSFPTASFNITKVEAAPESDTTGATHWVSGNLEMRGLTNNITIPAMVSMENGLIEFSTPEFVIDRSKWNVRFRSYSFKEFANVAKDKAIDNNIKLKVNLSASKA